MKKILIFVLIACFLIVVGAVYAAEPLKDQIAKQYAANNNNLDPVITNFIKQGTDVRELVKTCVQMGYEVCNVVNISLKAGADRQQIIFGALDGGATSDNLSRCEGLGYTYDPPAGIEPPRNNPVSSTVPNQRK